MSPGVESGEYVSDPLLDVDGTPANILTLNSSNDADENAETFGQEICLNGQTGDVIWII